MPKLHLVAITPDNRGLVLSDQAESNRGDLVLDIDDRLLDAIDRAQRQRARDEGRKLSSAALPSRKEPSADEEERLSPRQIQDRLRAGESVASIAKSSGADEAWVERFATPVLGELEMVVDRARNLTFTRPRVGSSKLPLGSAVAANLVERGVAVTADEVDEGWSAYQRADGTWLVMFAFAQRGRRQKAEWSIDLGSGELVARNKLATELGFRESGRRPSRPAATAPKAPPAENTAPESAAPQPEVEEVTAAPEVDDGRQTLPGTEPEIDSFLDSIGVAPPAPAASHPIPEAPPAPAAAKPVPKPRPEPAAKPVPESSPALAAAKAATPAPMDAPVEPAAPAETDPTIEVSLQAVPDPADPPRPASRVTRPDPDAPPPSSSS